MRDINVTCPCCQSYLEVDARSGKVVKWRRERELDETGKPILDEKDWDDVSSRVQNRVSDAVDKFDSSLKREQNRERDLDDLFKKASDKLKDSADDEEGRSI